MKRFFVITLFLIFALNSFCQEKYTLSGSIKDASNGEDLIGVTIYVKELPGTGTITNIYGFYSLTLPKGEYTIQYSYIGYALQEYKLNFKPRPRWPLDPEAFKLYPTMKRVGKKGIKS